MDHAVEPVDPFDLPDWLGTAEVTWTATSSVRGSHLISGVLSGDGATLACDLMAADLAYPEPPLPEQVRRQAHTSWSHGQVLLVSYDGRLTLAVPGTAYSADGVLETVGRLVKALGAHADRYTVAMRL